MRVNCRPYALRTEAHSLRPNHSGRIKSSPRGVLLLSPPGCGKSAFAKSLGNETGRPTLILDVGALLGSLVGQSEQNVRQALTGAGVKSAFYESAGTAHEWQTWRRSLHDFAPRLFRE